MGGQTNCWEYMQCGREPGGSAASERGICPACDAQEFDRVNDGENGGRFCWAVAGTFCHGQVQGSFAQKAMDCMGCEFYTALVHELRSEMILNPSQLE